MRRTVARALGAAGGSGGCAIDAAVLLDDFDYALPEELIAQQPAPRRDGSRLLHVGAGDALAHHQFDALPTLLVPGTLLVVNDAKVLPARVRAKKPSGGAVEVLFLGPAPADGEGVWSCLVRGKSLRPGTTLEVVASTVGSTGSTSSSTGSTSSTGSSTGSTSSTSSSTSASSAPAATITFLARLPDGTARVRPSPDAFAHGELPLPPYIARPDGATAEDRERYQTIYARAPGSVAAPTAGLHFTDEVLAALAARGIERAALTLDVGLGTFAPIRDDDLSRHVLHEESYSIPEATCAAIAAARADGRPVVAVGTTVVRALESAWDDTLHSPRPGSGLTRIFLRPGHTFRAPDLLLTNLHLPRSTLLMLVCAFAGRTRTLAAYRAAVAHAYRFFSYGDAMLLTPESPRAAALLTPESPR